jgi:protease PrsW
MIFVTRSRNIPLHNSIPPHPFSSSLNRFKRRLYHASRSRSFLWKFALGALLVGVAVGLGLSHLQPTQSYLFGERALARAGLTVQRDDEKARPPEETATQLLDALRNELSSTDVNFIELLWATPAFAPYIAPSDYRAFHEASRTRFDEEQSALATDFLGTWLGGDPRAFARLKARAASAEPPRFAHYVLGRLEFKQNNARAAFTHFRAEAEHADAEESRYMAVRSLADANDPHALDALRQDPRFAPYFTPRVALAAAIGARNWLGILKGVVAVQFASYRNSVIIVALVTAIGWGFFLLHFGEVQSPRTGYFWLCILGLVAGVISTIPTVYLVILQDEILQFSTGADPLRTFAYYVAGVGAREELCKLLLFVPLLPFLIRWHDDLAALIVACFVGLGFAVEENTGYFTMSAAASAPGRFLTANFFHIALTGANGLALFRACTRGVSGINDLMMTLPITILAHGAYDALLDLPQLDDSGFLAMIVFIGFCYLFFQRAHPLRSHEQMTISLTGAFVCGVSILAATVIAFQFTTLGPGAGASLIFNELLGSALLLVMFFRQFNESLAR